MSLHRREAKWGYLFIAPQILGLALFILGPILATLALSFAEWNLILPPKWVGLQNFQEQFSDSVFWLSLKNTFYYAVASVVLTMVVAMVFANILNSKLRFTTFYRSVYFVPVITNVVAVSMVWRWLYNYDFGLFNLILYRFGIEGPPWLNSTKWAMPALILMAVWKQMGYVMMLFLAGLQDIPVQLYEAGRIDGTTKWTEFRHITLPMLTPTIFFVLITSLIGATQTFGEVYIMTNGGPANSTRLILPHIYTYAFRLFELGQASAVSFVLFVILLILTLVQFRLSRRWVHYG